jgi:lysophospholipase
MGGHNAIRFVHDYPDVFTSLILSGPMVGINVPKTQVAVLTLFARLRGLVVSNKAYASGAGPYDESYVLFDNNGVTYDRARFDINVALNDSNKNLRLAGITFGWALAAVKSMKMMNKQSYIDEIKLPILCCIGKKDFVVSQEQVTSWANNCSTCRLEELDDCAHEILRETDEVQKEFWAFFDEHMHQF